MVQVLPFLNTYFMGDNMKIFKLPHRTYPLARYIFITNWTLAIAITSLALSLYLFIG